MKVSSINTSFIDFPNKTSLIVFMSGCNIGCKGCQNPKLQNPDYGVDIVVDDIVKEYNSKGLCNGIVFSGGDPLYQYGELLAYCKELCSIADIAVYTGETFDNVPVELFEYIDLLVTEPYIEELGGLSDPKTNQRCWDIIDGVPVENKKYFKVD